MYARKYEETQLFFLSLLWHCKEIFSLSFSKMSSHSQNYEQLLEEFLDERF